MDSTTILYTVASIGGIGALSSIILYIATQRFKVEEDPRIDDVDEVLPGANCGGCGYAGCRAFAEACVSQGNLEGLFCPVGGNDCMTQVADALGVEASDVEPTVAVLRCNGACESRPRKAEYDGVKLCSVAANHPGETDCSFGCLGHGDCVVACEFDAMYMDEETGLPVIIDEKCVACGACSRACPKLLIEMRKRFKKERKIFVACMNQDKGGVAKKACDVACIGCSKCFKVCPYEAIDMGNNLAFIDSDRCKLCRKCVSVCPTSAIIETNFPPPREPKAEPKSKEKTEVKTEARTDEKPTAEVETIAEAKPKVEAEKELIS